MVGRLAVDGNHKLGKATRDAFIKGWKIAYNELHTPVIAFAADMPESVRSYADVLKQYGKRCELHGNPVCFRMAVPWLTTCLETCQSACLLSHAAVQVLVVYTDNMDPHAAKLWRENYPTARYFKLDMFHLLQRLSVCIPASSRLKGKGPVDVISLQRLSHRGPVAQNNAYAGCTGRQRDGRIQRSVLQGGPDGPERETQDRPRAGGAVTAARTPPMCQAIKLRCKMPCDAGAGSERFEVFGQVEPGGRARHHARAEHSGCESRCARHSARFGELRQRYAGQRHRSS